MTSEGFRSLVYLVEIAFIFAFIDLFDILFVKNGIIFYLLLAIGIVIAMYLTYLLAKSLSRYFNY
ncbi:hypothetical protein DFR86_04700 [Acidianus sulfidivorans JP7]|uniref:Uncharacterized protein n=1 Tax=Acidianus sulfidivorans JP7 TaxID=619593 RepID=A0A2U9ILQ1_9CREN|nr:hypothetical protein [Acidianus sulfidivorans]AWR96925.1 hypothetical protein DFR86_04700 [Acidianus sulfidivorans JP7]